MNRKRLALFVLLILLAASIIWSYLSSPRPKVASPHALESGAQASRVTSRTATARPVTSPAVTAAQAQLPSSAGDPRILRLDLLSHGRTQFQGYRRNLFKPVFVDEIKVLQKKAAAAKPLLLPPSPAKAANASPPPPPPPPETKQQIARRELGKYTFIGLFGTGTTKTVFFSKGGALVSVKKGDIIERRYKASEITDQSLTVQIVENGEEIVVPLMDQLNLKAEH
jgi:hypothetical protein